MLLLTILLLMTIYFIYRQYNYWQRNGFPYDRSTKFPYGCLELVAKNKQNMTIAIHDVYMKSREAFVGIYLFFRPALLVRDVELIRDILMQNFESFHDRGIYVNEKNDPMSLNLFSAEGPSWKSMRNKFSPMFSTGKLKIMFEMSNNVASKMIEYMNSRFEGKSSATFNMEEITTTYAIDIISSVVFGLDTDSFNNPQNEFRSFIDFANRESFVNTLMSTLFLLCPGILNLMAYLGIRDQNVEKAQVMIKRAVEQRETQNIVRKDFIQLMTQLRNNEQLQEDDENYDWSVKSKNNAYKSMSVDAIAAQAFIFYIAGQGTTAMTAAYSIFEMAQHREVLSKAQQEVREVCERHNGEISFESLKEMSYLDLCIQETLRKYPGLGFLNRECTQDYAVPGSNKIIKRGTPIILPIYSLHYNPEYFANSEQYKPERFLEPDFRHDAYKPFGEGPRACIAMRMGQINSKLAVAKILQNFTMDALEKQKVEIAPHAIGFHPKNNLKVTFRKMK